MANAGGPNLRRRLIDIGANGNPTTIYATGPVRGWTLMESIITKEGVANVPQGYEVKIPNDGSGVGFQTWFARWAATQDAANPLGFSGDFPVFENWNHIAEHGPVGEVFGGPGSAVPGLGIGATTATVLAIVQSATATPTTIEFVEYF